MTRPILFPVDLGDESSWHKALPEAAMLARQKKVELHILTVIPDFGMPIVGSYFPQGFTNKARAEAEHALADFAQEYVPEDVPVTCHVLHGKIYKEIIALADGLNCEVIVMASHRPEMKDYLLGPNAARVVRHARQSVYVVREN